MTAHSPFTIAPQSNSLHVKSKKPLFPPDTQRSPELTHLCSREVAYEGLLYDLIITYFGGQAEGVDQSAHGSIMAGPHSGHGMSKTR